MAVAGAIGDGWEGWGRCRGKAGGGGSSLRVHVRVAPGGRHVLLWARHLVGPRGRASAALLPCRVPRRQPRALPCGCLRPGEQKLVCVCVCVPRSKGCLWSGRRNLDMHAQGAACGIPRTAGLGLKRVAGVVNNNRGGVWERGRMEAHWDLQRGWAHGHRRTGGGCRWRRGGPPGQRKPHPSARPFGAFWCGTSDDWIDFGSTVISWIDGDFAFLGTCSISVQTDQVCSQSCLWAACGGDGRLPARDAAAWELDGGAT